MAKTNRFLCDVLSGILKIENNRYIIDSAINQLSVAEGISGSSYLVDESYSLYEHLMIWSERNGFLTTFLKSEIGVPANDVTIAGLLDLPSLQSVQSNSVMIFFPLYCRNLPLEIKERGLHFAKFEVHRSLQT